MPASQDIGSPPPIPAGSRGHGDHGVAAAAPAGLGHAFSSVLAQTMSQSLNNGASVNAASHSGGHAPGTNVRGGSVQHGLLPGRGDQRGAHGPQETALGLRAYRQQLLAGNIANADTPGYKAVDIDFQEALRLAQAAARVSPLALAVTGLGHLAARAIPVSPPFQLKYHIPSQPSADGNTVEMDVERAKFAENALMYEFSLDRVGGHSKMMMELFQNLKS